MTRTCRCGFPTCTTRPGSSTRQSPRLRPRPLDPESYDTFELLGSLYFERGDYRRAIDACRRATQLNPYDQSAYITMADSLLFLGRDDESTGRG